MKSRKDINGFNFFLVYLFPSFHGCFCLSSRPQNSPLTQSVMTKCTFHMLSLSSFACMCHTCAQKYNTTGLLIPFSLPSLLCVIKMLIETKSGKRYVITCVCMSVNESVNLVCVHDVDLRTFPIVFPHIPASSIYR